MPARLASESIRNWPDSTTRCPARKPCRISVWPPASIPVTTSAGRKRPSASASITSVRLPVATIASVGTRSVLSSRSSAKLIRTNMPGTRRPRGLASSIRALSVRVAGFTSGSSACTRPSKVSPGSAGLVAVTGAPGASCAAWLSGTSALAHTVARPLMCASVMPGITVIPSRAISSVTAPPMGARIVSRACTRPLDSTSRICASSMPAWRMRARAASTSAARSVPCMRRTDRKSSCAATQSGT